MYLSLLSLELLSKPLMCYKASGKAINQLGQQMVITTANNNELVK